MSQENEQNIVQQEVTEQEQIATDAVAASDLSVAEQATGYLSHTPEQAAQVANAAVVATE